MQLRVHRAPPPRPNQHPFQWLQCTERRLTVSSATATLLSMPWNRFFVLLERQVWHTLLSSISSFSSPQLDLHTLSPPPSSLSPSKKSPPLVCRALKKLKPCTRGISRRGGHSVPPLASPIGRSSRLACTLMRARTSLRERWSSPHHRAGRGGSPPTSRPGVSGSKTTRSIRLEA